MKKLVYLLAIIIFFLSGCTESFKKGDKGLEYKIISEGKGNKVAYGDFLQVHVKQFYKDAKRDTTLSDSRESGMPQIFTLDSMNTPAEYFKILSQLKEKDSLVIRVKSDSIIKNTPPQALPPFIKKGQYLYTTLKILNIFKTAQQADSANRIAFENKRKQDSINAISQSAKDDKIIAEYLAKNNIKAKKTDLGTYVEILQEGTGALIDSTVTVKVNYTGKTLGGTTFDSNVDPQFNHVQPYLVTMTPDPGMGGVIKGWTDGLLLLRKGAKARFYIPSTLGYGAQGAGRDIKPNEILIFDIEVLDVLNKEQAMAEAEKARKEMEVLQQKYLDSIKKAQTDTVNKKQ